MAADYKKISFEKKATAKKIMTPYQFKECKKCIHVASLGSALGGSLPIPVMDSIPITGCQITMVLRLGKIFDIKLTESVAKGFINAAAGTLIGRSIVKFLPVVGPSISAAVAAGLTEAIGWMVALDLARGNLPSCNDSNPTGEYSTSHQQADASGNNELENIIVDLTNRSAPFLSGKNSSKDHSSDFWKLIEYSGRF